MINPFLEQSPNDKLYSKVISGYYNNFTNSNKEENYILHKNSKFYQVSA
ncbi:MAG: hypothetical protein M3Y53_05570 [Thermoproteota archaeon]|nr:hypothetical protein [Thermoproteota archaeon]